MPLDLANFEDRAHAAVRHFWANRLKTPDPAAIPVQGGTRAGVLAGKNLDGFLELIAELVRRNGLDDATLHVNGDILTLPGYFRATKKWDVLVLDGERLVAVLELKSQVGSFGKNLNNRAEETIGSAHDFWTAYRESAFGKDMPRPFAGWLHLVEDSPASRVKVREKEPHFPVFPEFKGKSYLERYEILCRRLQLEKLYDQASVITSRQQDATTGDYGEISPSTNLRSFCAKLAGHVAAWAEQR